jgi:hypothetical protein
MVKLLHLEGLELRVDALVGHLEHQFDLLVVGTLAPFPLGRGELS